VRSLAAKSLQWTKLGGYVFFRESCFRQSGNVSRTFNPSHYRHPAHYTDLFSSVTCIEADGTPTCLELVTSRNLETYVRVKGNKGQMCWLWRKVPVAERGALAASAVPRPLPPRLLERSGKDGALIHERLFGPGFTNPGEPTRTHTPPQSREATPARPLNKFRPSSGRRHQARAEPDADRACDCCAGGAAMAGELAGLLNLQAGNRLLDLESGVGGAVILLAETLHIKAWGVEPTPALVSLAVERSMARPKAYTVFEVSRIAGVVLCLGNWFWRFSLVSTLLRDCTYMVLW
jgi:hypothetical protein